MSEIESKKSEVLKDISDDQLLEEVFRRNGLKERFFQKVALEKMLENGFIKNTTSAIQGVISENSEAELIQNIQNFMDTYKDLDIDINDYRISITNTTIRFPPKERSTYPGYILVLYKR